MASSPLFMSIHLDLMTLQSFCFGHSPVHFPPYRLSLCVSDLYLSSFDHFVGSSLAPLTSTHAANRNARKAFRTPLHYCSQRVCNLPHAWRSPYVSHAILSVPYRQLSQPIQFATRPLFIPFFNVSSTSLHDLQAANLMTLAKCGELATIDSTSPPTFGDLSSPPPKLTV